MRKTFLDQDFNHGVSYLPRPPKRFNLILAVDSYKFSHAFAYPKAIAGMAAYIEARTGGQDIIIPAGMQPFLQRYFQTPITLTDIDEAEAFAAAHGEPFKRATWEYILKSHKGLMPLMIRAVPEGTPVRSGNAIVSIICTDKLLDSEAIFWLCSYFETMILRGVWYPSTIATMDNSIKKIIRGYYERTGADLNGLDFALHDFGARGCTAHEQAEIGGAAHTFNFKGSDTVEGITYANYWYYSDMSAFSVPATEHSVECSFGLNPEQEIEYIRHVLQNLGKRGGIVSIVIDGKDVYRATAAICTVLKDEIIASGCKVVLRPDSGDMMEVVPRILHMLASTFGYETNTAGFKKIKYVGVLQGDGVDHLAIQSLLGKLMALGYAADNVVFGSGGALLQKVNRDTFKWAQKASAVLKDGEWIGIAKDPITDPGKKSKEGVLTLARSKMTGLLETVRVDKGLDDEWEDVMVTLYNCGVFYNVTTLDEIRARITA